MQATLSETNSPPASEGAASEDAPGHFGRTLRTNTFRLALAYCALFTVGVSLLLGTIYLLTESVLGNEVDYVIGIEIDALADEYDREGLVGVMRELDRLNASWGRARAIYLLVDRRLDKLAGNINSWPLATVPEGPWLEFSVAAGPQGSIEEHPVRARVFTLPEGYLLVGTEISQRRLFQQRFKIATLWGIGGTALLGAAMGFWLSRRLLARVSAVSIECERILAGDLSRRLPVAGADDEFDSLSIAVNRVLERLDEQTGVLRATFESTAHDLRGPLFRLRGRLEEQLRSARMSDDSRVALDRALRDIDSVQRTLAVLLQIAHAESGSSLAESGPVQLDELVVEMGSLYEPAARDQGMSLRWVTSRASVNGDRQLLTQLIANLIENGLKHVGRGGEITITVSERNGAARLEVADNGPGIPAADRERVLRPFVQLAPKSANGSGLGLSLVAAIARLHRARLTLEDNTPGLKVVVLFG